MCRHAAWLGAPRTLDSLIHEPEHGLLRQSYAPRRQRYGHGQRRRLRHGLVRPRPRGAGPLPPCDPHLGGRQPAGPRAGRPLGTACWPPYGRATVGMPIEETATAPFADGPWLLSHNGRVAREAVRDAGRRRGELL